jgi:hypothetical protein
MHKYVLAFGFVIYTDNTMMATLKQHEGYRILNDSSCILLRSSLQPRVDPRNENPPWLLVPGQGQQQQIVYWAL